MNLPDAAPRQYSPHNLTVVWGMVCKRGPVESLACSIKAVRDMLMSHITPMSSLSLLLLLVNRS